MKFDYYLFYKCPYYILLDRNKKEVCHTISFYSIICALDVHHIPFDRVKLKSMLLSDFFNDYADFRDKKGERI